MMTEHHGNKAAEQQITSEVSLVTPVVLVSALDYHKNNWLSLTGKEWLTEQPKKFQNHHSKNAENPHYIFEKLTSQK